MNNLRQIGLSGLAAVLVLLAVAALSGLSAVGPARAEPPVLTGDWDVSGNTGAGPFTCDMTLVHDPNATPPPSTPTAPPGSPIVYVATDLSGQITCTQPGGSGTTTGSISGSVNEANRTLAFNAYGLFGCFYLTGTASYNEASTTMSNGQFTCSPQVIASWTAVRVSGPPLPEPTPTPAPTPGAVGGIAGIAGGEPVQPTSEQNPDSTQTVVVLALLVLGGTAGLVVGARHVARLRRR